MTSPFAGEKTHVYGPGTPMIRRFLVQLAGLGAADRADVVQRHHAAVNTRAYIAAETALGETIDRAGRADARDALAGPLLQLVRNTDSPSDADDADDALAILAPIAEPALAALLALLVADLLPPATVSALYDPFAEVMPMESPGSIPPST